MVAALTLGNKQACMCDSLHSEYDFALLLMSREYEMLKTFLH